MPSKWVAHCHCTRCQRAHGAPFVTWAGFEATAVGIDDPSKSLRWHVAPEGGHRGFCSTCGSPMFFKAERYVGELHIARALFVDPLDREPEVHVYYDTHVDWATVGDDLPRKPEPSSGKKSHIDGEGNAMHASPGPYQLSSTFLRLRPDTSIEPLTVDQTFWPRLIDGSLGDFHHEYLVTMLSFDSRWPTWEMHPQGDEIVCVIAGEVEFTLEQDGVTSILALRRQGDFVLVPKGAWHIATPVGTCTLLFITAGEGTVQRPADAPR